MLLHLPIVMLATLSPVTVSDTVPKFDIARQCRFEGGSTIQFQRCSDDEGDALRDLQSAWTQFAVVDKRDCVAEATTGGSASYVELLTCLEMARDVKGGDSTPRDPPRTDPIRPAGPGVTVGVGQDPVTPGQTQGQDGR